MLVDALCYFCVYNFQDNATALAFVDYPENL